jgi:NitT/TauT family transport system substrate-binding protein
MMQRLTKFRIPVILALTALITAACAQATPEPEELRKLTFMVPVPVLTTFYFPPNVADELGFFEEEGLEVEIVTGAGAPLVLQQMAVGNVDAGYVTASVGLNAFSQGQEVVAVYEDFDTSVFDLWVLPDSGISTVEDLRGKNIGVEGLQGGHIPELRAWLTAAGLTIGEDVNLLGLGDDSATVVEAFNNGTVDAYDLSTLFSIGPSAELGLVPLNVPAQVGETPQVGVFVTRELFDNEPEVVEGLGRALVKAAVFGLVNPDAVRAIQAEVFPPEQENEDFAKVLMNVVLETMVGSDDFDPNQELGRTAMDGWERLQDLLLATGAEGGLEGAVEVRDFVTNELISIFNDFDRDELIKFAEEYE